LITKKGTKMIKMIKLSPEIKKTFCANCEKPTGFGFGVEPLRHDKDWCTSECHKEFYKQETK